MRTQAALEGGGGGPEPRKMRSHYALYLNSDLNGILEMLGERAGPQKASVKALKPA